LGEIAVRLNVQRNTAEMWRKRRVLPPPDFVIGGRPGWDWATIQRWARDTGRVTEHR
jgi:hypothetical protein